MLSAGHAMRQEAQASRASRASIKQGTRRR